MHPVTPPHQTRRPGGAADRAWLQTELDDLFGEPNTMSGEAMDEIQRTGFDPLDEMQRPGFDPLDVVIGPRSDSYTPWWQQSPGLCDSEDEDSEDGSVRSSDSEDAMSRFRGVWGSFGLGLPDAALASSSAMTIDLTLRTTPDRVPTPAPEAKAPTPAPEAQAPTPAPEAQAPTHDPLDPHNAPVYESMAAADASAAAYARGRAAGLAAGHRSHRATEAAAYARGRAAGPAAAPPPSKRARANQ